MKANPSCNLQIDYSGMTGERRLPFVISLNLEDSILTPSENEHQKFCYDIVGVGNDQPQDADLNHLLFGICPFIKEEDIVDLSVSINDDPQTILWGENAEIKTAENPDQPTGCVGLKLDFPLNKINGYMKVCFSLRTVYTIGPVNVCLFGGNTTATGLTVCGPVCGSSESCESIFYQKESICVPVTITPYATPGTATATCCGTPIIRQGTTCGGEQTSCTFTVTQNLCIEIPISFGAAIETGAASVQCGNVSEEPCDCSETPEEIPTEVRDRRFFLR